MSKVAKTKVEQGKRKRTIDSLAKEVHELGGKLDAIVQGLATTGTTAMSFFPSSDDLMLPKGAVVDENVWVELGPGLSNCCMCDQRTAPGRDLAGYTQQKERLVRATERKWVNGTQLTYAFLGGEEADRQVVHAAFLRWQEVQGITFVHEHEPSYADIRIAFNADGSWSYVGRDVLTIPKSEPTMNFGWSLTDAYGMRTALHEIGHTLGFYHEHQNPIGGIVWNEDQVISDLAGPPNYWSEATARHNVLRKIAASMVDGSGYDMDSIMHYGLPAGWVIRPEELAGGWTPSNVLSATDVLAAEELYPKEEVMASATIWDAFECVSFPLAANEEITVRVQTKQSGQLYLETKGMEDTLLVVQDANGSTLVADDDSGTALNARVGFHAFANTDYFAKVRLYTTWKETEQIGLVSWR